VLRFVIMIMIKTAIIINRFGSFNCLKYVKNSHLIIVHLMFFCSSFVVTLPATALTSKPIPAPITLRVALDDNYPPYVIRREDGSLEGYLVDEWKLWEKKTGVHVKLLASNWNVAQKNMVDGNADIIDTIFLTPERARILDFMPTYAQIPVNIYTDIRLVGIGNLVSLHGFQVGVKAGDACANKLIENGITNLIPFAGYEELVQASITMKIHVFCMDEPPANYLIFQAHAEKQIHMAFPLYVGEFHRAVHKGDTVTLALAERGFAAVTPNELKALQKKWMGTSLSNPFQRNIQYGLSIAIIIILCLTAFIFILRTLVKKRTADLLSTRNKLLATLDALPDLMFELGLDGHYYDYHSPRTDLLAAPAEVFLGKTLFDVLPLNVAQAALSTLQQAHETGYSSGEYKLDLPQGERWFEFTVSRKSTSQDQEPRFIVLSRDITERRQVEERIQYLAHFDMLTGLPNRTELNDHSNIAFSHAKRSHENLAIMFLDLDYFKDINDTLGHSVGDALLITLSARIKLALREEDTVSRLGGDEFIFLLPGANATGAAQVAQKMLDHISEPYQIGLHELSITASIGIAIYPDDGNDMEMLSKNADVAMYRAKNEGRNGYRFFTQEMQILLSRNMQLLTALRNALKLDQLQVYYQPQISMQNGKLVGMEALLRWQHPEFGAVPPSEFIPIAESSGLILSIGEWVLRTAVKQAKTWQEAGLAHIVLAVNLSAVQFRHLDLPDLVSRVLNETELSPEYLELELTESTTMQDPPGAIAVMNNLHQRGVRMSIDDFGTGYSSLSYLKKFKVYKLKIDQSFVRDISTDPEDKAIVVAIISLATSLGMQTIAEGVETIEQFNFLRENGCNEVQGFYYSKPLPAEKFELFVRNAMAISVSF